MLGILDEFAVDGIDPASESDLEPLKDGLKDCEEVRLSRPSPALVILPGRLSDFGRLVALPIFLFGSDLWLRKRYRQEGKMMILILRTIEMFQQVSLRTLKNYKSGLK
jgi:hypothetical protein